MYLQYSGAQPRSCFQLNVSRGVVSRSKHYFVKSPMTLNKTHGMCPSLLTSMLQSKHYDLLVQAVLPHSASAQNNISLTTPHHSKENLLPLPSTVWWVVPPPCWPVWAAKAMKTIGFGLLSLNYYDLFLTVKISEIWISRLCDATKDIKTFSPVSRPWVLTAMTLCTPHMLLVKLLVVRFLSV